MSDHWNIQLLNQHAAILKSALKTVNTVARSIGEEAEALEAERSGPTMAEAMLARAVEDLHFVMAGGAACKVCARKCTFGTGACKPVWKGEEAQEPADTEKVEKGR